MPNPEQPYFSIITPVYNGGNFIQQYVQSLQSQTYRDWEAIIIDDNSSDDSFRMLSSLLADDPRVKIIASSISADSAILRGPYRPRNYGLRIATGRFICFFDIDDYWLPSKLQAQHSVLESNKDIKLLYSDYIKADFSLSHGYVKPSLSFLPVKWQIAIWNPIPNLTSCVDSSIAKEICFRPVNHEDYIFWFEVIARLHSLQICKIHSILCIYRSSSLSVSANKFRVLSWWFDCYRFFGYNIFLSISLLLFKISAEAIESLLVFTRLIPCRPISFAKAFR
jgi:glycosyltransferase involved in cell wall biosynthesis